MLWKIRQLRGLLVFIVVLLILREGPLMASSVSVLSPRSSFTFKRNLKRLSSIKSTLYQFTSQGGEVAQRAHRILDIISRWEKKEEYHFESFEELASFIKSKEKSDGVEVDDLLLVYNFLLRRNAYLGLQERQFLIAFLGRQEHSLEPHLAMMAGFIFNLLLSENREALHVNEPAVLTLENRSAKILGQRDQKGELLPPHPNNHAYIGAFLDEKGDLLKKHSTMISFNRRQDLNQFLQDNPLFTGVVEKIYLGAKGDLRNFMGQASFWTGMTDFPNAEIRVQIVSGKILTIHEVKSKTLLFPFSENHVYEGASLDEGGNRVGGAPVANTFIRRNKLNELLEKKEGFTGVVEHLRLKARGRLGVLGREEYWDRLEGYEDVLIKAFIEEGKLKSAYDYDGNQIFPMVQPTLQVYMGASLDKDHIRINGSHVEESFKFHKTLNAYLEKHKDISCVIENVPLGADRGDLRKIGNEYFWYNKKGYEGKQVKILIESGKVTRIVDYEGKVLYQFSPNRIYSGAQLDDHGQVTGGVELEESFPSRNMINQYLKKHPNFTGVIRNVVLSKSGGLGVIGREKLWNNMGGLWKVGVNVEIVQGKISRVFDYRGKQLYPFAENHLYWEEPESVSRGSDVSLQKTPLTFVERTSLNRYLKEHPQFSGAIDKVRLYKEGGIGEIGNNILWYSMRGYSSNDLVKVYIQEGKVVSVYNQKGEKIYPYEVNQVYPKAFISTDRVTQKVDETEMFSFPTKNYLSGFLKKHPNFSGVIENVELNKNGGLGDLGYERFWAHKNTHKGQMVTVELKEGRVSLILDQDLNILYNSNDESVGLEGAYIDQYGNTILRNTKVTRKFKGRKNIASFLKKNSSFSGVIENVVLDSRGGLRKFGRSRLWSAMKGYENSPVKIYVRKGKVIRVFDNEGNQLYPYGDNNIYTHSTLNYYGERSDTQKTRLKSFNSRHGINHYLAKRNFTGVVETKLNGNGGLTRFNAGKKEFWNRLPGYENALVRIYMKDGEVVKVFDLNGVILYPKLEPNSVFRKLWNSDDLLTLIKIFGAEGATRIIVQFYNHGNLMDILEFSKVLFKGLNAFVKNPFKARESLSAEIFIADLERVEIFNRALKKEDKEVVKDELQRRLYKEVVSDPEFLDRLKGRLKSSKVTPFLRECFSSAINSFEEVSNLSFKGLRPSTKLKFYQLAGVEFILKMKRALLADEPGLGKTLQTLIAAMNAYNGKGAQKILIVCPHISKDNVWLKQIKEHLSGVQKVAVIKKRKDIRHPATQKKIQESRFVVVNPELIRGDEGSELRQGLKELKPDFIIVDEAHSMRNDSLLSKAIHELKAEYQVLVSGTPLVGRDPKKMFNLLHWLDPIKFPSLKSFIETIENGQFTLYLKKIMLRRYVKDVFNDMPLLKVILRRLKMSSEQARLYFQIEENIFKDKVGSFIGKLNLLKYASIDGSLVHDISFIQTSSGKITKQIPGIQQIHFGDLSYHIYKDQYGHLFLVLSRDFLNGDLSQKIPIRNGRVVQIGEDQFRVNIQKRTMPSSKLDEVDRLTKDIVENKNESVSIFSSSLATVKKLKKRYEKKGYNVLAIYGKVSVKQRREIIQKYNQSKKPYVIVCTYQSAGESIELIGGANGILIDQPWTIQGQDQIFRRVLRFGQLKDVTFYVLQNENTIDEYIHEVLREGEFIEKVLIDNPNHFLDTENEITQRSLEDIAKRENQVALLKKLEGAVKRDNKPQSSRSQDFSITGDSSHGTIFLGRVSGKLSGELFLENQENLNPQNLRHLIDHFKEMDTPSKELTRKYFRQRLTLDVRGAVNSKELLLSDLFRTYVPGLKMVDYDSTYSLYARLGTLILREFLEEPNLRMSDLAQKMPEVPEEILEKTLLFLEENNLFLLFQYLFDLPHLHFSKGEFHESSAPLQLLLGEQIRFIDEERVRAIAPRWDQPNLGVSVEGLKGFKRSSLSYRDLSPDEEAMLYEEFHRGNESAQNALVATYLKKLPSLAYGAKRKIFSLFGAKVSSSIEEERLISYGLESLTQLINEFSEIGIFDTISPWDYISKSLSSKMHRRAFSIAKEIMELKADQGKYGGNEVSEVTFAQDLVDEGAFYERDQEEVTEVFEQFLGDLGFNLKESFVLKRTFIDDLSFDQLLSLFREEFHQELSQESFNQTLSRFQSIADQVGYEKVKAMLEGEVIEIDQEPMSEVDEMDLDSFLLENMVEAYGREIMSAQDLVYFDFSGKILQRYGITWDSPLIELFIAEMFTQIMGHDSEHNERDLLQIKNVIIERAA